MSQIYNSNYDRNKMRGTRAQNTKEMSLLSETN